jgi:mono/diheme cytochrome c family protein
MAMKKLLGFLVCGIFLFPGIALAGEPTLTLVTKTGKKTFTISELLKRKDTETVIVENDPVYPGQKMEYVALKVTSLFDQIELDDAAVIQFKTLDGFSAPVSRQRLLNKSSKESIAYIAIELPDKKWPPMKPGKPSAGPFYLIWMNPELSHISSEEWSYMLAAFEVKDSLETTYPEIFPSNKLSGDDPVTKGFRLFVKNCFACHTMNKVGASGIGPDLNVPMNPTEYFRTAALKKLIRNPQAVRHWPNGRMKGFKQEILGDQDLNQLVAYLEHMSRRRK